MTWLRKVAWAGLFLSMQACSDDDVPHPGDGGMPDGGVTDGGSQACAVGDQSMGTFGPRGGELSFCGAKVAMAAGVLESEREVTLTVVELPTAAPFPLEQAGVALDIDVQGGVPAAAAPPLSVLVPHEQTTRYVYFFHVDEQGYQGLEACTVEPTAIGQSVFVDGTYVALADTEDFPESRQGLGRGTVTARFDGVEQTYDLDATGFDTYAIYNQDEAGARTFTLAATKSTAEDQTLIMRMTFAVDAGGTRADFIEVTYGDLTGLYGYLPFDDGPAQIVLTEAQGASVQGAFEVELRLGDIRKLLTGSFEASAEKFRYPPELSCGSFPEG